MIHFTKKGWGRIYVLDPKDIDEVKKVILELDEFKFEYLPKDFIAPFSEYPETVYVGKFCDLCINQLTAECWKRGIIIWAFDDGKGELGEQKF